MILTPSSSHRNNIGCRDKLESYTEAKIGARSIYKEYLYNYPLLTNMGMDSGTEGDEGEKLKVLIADASTFMCIMLTAALEKLNYEVIGTSKDGNDAIEKYMEQKPDIVLVDPALKEKDGIEVTRIITTENPATVVLVLLTGTDSDPDIIVESVRAGARGYIKLPVTEAEIKARLESALKLE